MEQLRGRAGSGSVGTESCNAQPDTNYPVDWVAREGALDVSHFKRDGKGHRSPRARFHDGHFQGCHIMCDEQLRATPALYSPSPSSSQFLVLEDGDGEHTAHELFTICSFKVNSVNICD